jgi:hypothetical protein
MVTGPPPGLGLIENLSPLTSLAFEDFHFIPGRDIGPVARQAVRQARSRTRLVRIATGLSNQIRRLMKTLGLIVPHSTGGRFKAYVDDLLAD